MKKMEMKFATRTPEEEERRQRAIRVLGPWLKDYKPKKRDALFKDEKKQ